MTRFDVEYPKNEVGQFYKDLMGGEQGGGLDPYNMRRSWKEISLSGAYRNLMAKPTEKVEFEIRSYKRDDEQLAETDADRLIKEGKVGEDFRKAVSDVDTTTAEESKIAVILKMKLGSSQYATMVLRELSAGGLAPYRPESS